MNQVGGETRGGMGIPEGGEAPGAGGAPDAGEAQEGAGPVAEAAETEEEETGPAKDGAGLAGEGTVEGATATGAAVPEITETELKLLNHKHIFNVSEMLVTSNDFCIQEL